MSKGVPVVCQWGCTKHFYECCEFRRMDHWQGILLNIGAILVSELKDKEAGEFVWNCILEQDESFTPAKFNLNIATDEEIQIWQKEHPGRGSPP